MKINPKSNKGITLTSLIIYVLAMTIIACIVATITIYFHKNTKEIQQTADNSYNFTRLNEYMESDAQNAKTANVNNNKLEIVTKDNETITYTYINNTDDKSIYRNKAKICDGVEQASFQTQTIYDKTKLTVGVRIGENETISKTLEFTIKN